jgi:hypothetical protein
VTPDRRHQYRVWQLALDRFELSLARKARITRNAYLRAAALAYEANGTVPGWADEAHRRAIQAMLTGHYQKVIPYFGAMSLRQVRREKKQSSFFHLISEWVSTQAVRKAQMIADTDRDDVRGAIQGGIDEGLGTEEIARRIRKVSQLTPFRAATVARTETNSAATFGSIQSVRQAEQELGVRMLKVWLPTMDDRTREAHREMVNHPAIPLDEKFTVGGEAMDRPGDPGASAENTVNCVLPDSVLECKELLRVTRHWYEGVAVRIETECGNRITVTPNHPVLSSKGWVAANSISEGESILCGSFAQRRVLDLNVQHADATIEQVYDALVKRWDAVRVSRGVVDFHGDRPQHDIDVVDANSKLGIRHAAPLLKPLREFRLAYANFAQGCLLAQSLLLLGRAEELFWLVADCLVSFGRKAKPLFRACLGHAKAHRLAPAAGLDPGVGEAGSYHGPASSQLFGDGFDRMPAAKKSDAGLGKLATRAAVGAWFSDRVIDIRHIDYQGFVYNAETRQGYYICNGIVNHNCRCSLAYEEANN